MRGKKGASVVALSLLLQCVADFMNVLIVQHTQSEGPGWWGEFLAEIGARSTIAHPPRGDTLDFNPRDFDWMLCLGGPMNVYEEESYPWLRAENVFIQNWLQAEVPYLGVCLGAQLLAKASGVPVVRSPQTEIGWGEVELNAQGLNDPLFASMPSRFPVLHWHGDMAQMPQSDDGASCLAWSQGCLVQALRIGDKAYGVQFHVEVTPAMLEEWTEESTAYLAENPASQPASPMIEQARRTHHKARSLSRQVFDNFCKIAS